MRLMLLIGLVTGLAWAQNSANYTVAVTFAGGGWFDRSFNQGTWEGVTKAVSELSTDNNIDVLVFDASNSPSSQGHLSIARSGADLIVAAGFLQETAIAETALAYPETSFVLIDGVTNAANARSVFFKEHEGSYLVGYLAGKMSQTGVIGFVGGMDIPLIRAFGLGYREGMLAACPNCQLIEEYIGTTAAAFNDPARARELASGQQQRAADIIYAAAGNSGLGVINFINDTLCYNAGGFPLRSTPLSQTIASLPKSEAYLAKCQTGTQPLFFIGVDSNQNWLGDNDRISDSEPRTDTMNHALTSMLKRVDIAAETAVRDVISGSFTGGTVTLGLAENAVGYALDEYNRPLIPEEVINELENIKQQIINGTIVVTDYRTLP